MCIENQFNWSSDEDISSLEPDVELCETALREDIDLIPTPLFGYL